VFRNLTVEENLHLVLQMMPLTAAERRERADMLMEELGITRLRHNLGRTLSGGERRRVEIARALATRPKFILLDEPFTGVDPIAIEDIGSIIHRLAGSQERIGILITDHNVNAMLSITQRAYIVADGRVRTSGRSDLLAYDPEARASYFGKNFMTARQAAEEELRQVEEELRHATGASPQGAPPQAPTANAASAKPVTSHQSPVTGSQPSATDTGDDHAAD
jgi:lipopolysaccharide export system ATP-binding protein